MFETYKGMPIISLQTFPMTTHAYYPPEPWVVIENETNRGMWRCDHCQTGNDYGGHFCEQCGAPPPKEIC